MIKKDNVLEVSFYALWLVLTVLCIKTSVATKIENGPKTNTKILRILKIDRRRIRRIFVNSKILRRSSKIANSSNIFEDTKIFKGKWKIFVVKIFFQSATWTNFLSSRTQHYVGEIEVQKFKKSTYFLTFSDNFVHNIVEFSQKIFVTFGLKSSKLRRFFGIWKWTEDEDEDGSSDKNLRSFEDLRSFVATLKSIFPCIVAITWTFFFYAFPIFTFISFKTVALISCAVY